MSRVSIPFSAGDLSALARSLRDQLVQCDHTPSHLELLNMLARCAGHRNYQSLRAQAAAENRLHQAQPAPAPVDYVLVKRLAAYFDARGRLKSWPAKESLRETCLWVFWSRLPAKQSLSEAQLSTQLRTDHLFGDHALLRRELCDHGLVSRTPDGRQYRRVERQPPAEAAALIHHLRPRLAAAEGRTQ
ncbi:DUF2087 domain-containing protein [uncultured Paludibaculum sp.]|uniref:DUF2087 domain-containing protein n=1 Tax=uncultured Paludibaculum sp. TaxID=1765020 RepID=UPI002AABE7D8|nr:DUF2087 domain-containing protein [uncultured Paludibaculum sp.]